MRKLTFLLLLTVLAVSCHKISLTKGTYEANTPDGVIYVELQSGHNCEAYFAGEKKESGYYEISNGEIDLIVHAEIGSHSWWFGGSLGKGKIAGDSFSIQSQWMRSTNPEYRELVFKKR